MTWRVGKALLKLRRQVDAAYPNRSRGSDGTIGDASHASRSSDHNPWVGPDSDGNYIVTAMDITHDPRHGVDTYEMADVVRRSLDPRVKYIISNRRIAAPTIANNAWRRYTGVNPHDHHMHVSVRSSREFYDNERRDWVFGDSKPDASAPAAERKPVLQQGSRGPDVVYLQKAIGMPAEEQDGYFEGKTEVAVSEFQKEHGLVADGIVGPQTWNAVMAGNAK